MLLHLFLGFALWVQSTALSTSLAGSTWAYPVIGALHVLGLAWFGGAVLLTAWQGRDREARPRPAVLRAGAAMMVVTGALLFAIEPLRCAASASFTIKMLLLAVLIGIVPLRSKLGNTWGAVLRVVLWAAVVLAARGITFF
jgi:hypothetical protein